MLLAVWGVYIDLPVVHLTCPVSRAVLEPRKLCFDWLSVDISKALCSFHLGVTLEEVLAPLVGLDKGPKKLDAFSQGH